MLSLERFQELVLPYLYDLLDADERSAFEATLLASAPARASLDLARTKQRLLAEAVKSGFADLTLPDRNRVVVHVAGEELRSAGDPHLHVRHATVIGHIAVQLGDGPTLRGHAGAHAAHRG